MSEVQSRGSASRGRGGFRGGRGGYRGARGGNKSHTRSEEQENNPPLEEQGEVGVLKAKYSDKLPLLREVFEGWSDEDLVFALQETNGDAEAAIDRITSGTISQWGEVKKKAPKSKEHSVLSNETNTRGRGRGSLEGRGRGRGTERATRAGRGARAVSQANGTKHAEKKEESNGEPTNGDTAATTDWTNEPGKDKLESLETEQAKPASSAAPGGKAGGWASLFAKPPPPPVTKKASEPSVTASEEKETVPAAEEPELVIPPPPIEPVQVEEEPTELPSAPHSDVAAGDLTPSLDELTEKNLDKLPDVSQPAAIGTAASTAASTQDPLNPALPAASAIRPGMSGYAASALKATTGTGRSASFTRKILEQQEAVVMPGNHAVDRTAVQFGKMGMNDSDDLEAEDDREEPETRTQLPDDSPVAPRASLPPTLSEAPPSTAVETPAEPPRPAPGLPPAPAQQSSPQQASYDQYRYGQGQKPYDPFTQQSQAPATTSEPFSSQVPGHAPQPGSADYSQYYGREYQQYYAGYNQSQERSGSAFGTSGQETQGQHTTAGPRYGQTEAQTSGPNTPAPTSQQGQQQSQHLQQGPNQNYPYAGYGNTYGQGYPQYNNSYMNQMGRYGANRPMFDDVRRQDSDYYANQYSYGHNQQYGNNYKSNMYGGPQHQYSHDYSSSPANASFSRETYGRTGSTQPSEAQQTASTGSNAFTGGMQDPFARTPSGFGQSQHGSQGGAEDPAKATGPSPANRPGSAVNTMPGQQQGLPHPQSQQAFGGYPQYGGFGNQNSHSGYGAYGSNNAFGGGYAGYGRGWTGNYGSGQH